MNKILLVIYFSLFSILSHSQSKNQDSFFSIDSDTVTFYIDQRGDIVPKSEAAFYRKVKLNTNSFSYSGKLSDHFMNNQVAYECNYPNGKLNGSVKCFYPNGKLKYSGYFNDFLRDSIWTFFYDNGSVEKTIHFTNDTPYVKEYYKKNGKMVFNDGNGKLKSTILYGEKPLPCTISGKIVDGKMEGAWHWNGDYAQGIEYFENGEYIKTENFGLNDGFNNPRVISITGYEPHENVTLFNFIAIPQESNKSSVEVKGIPLVFKSEHIATSISLDSLSTNNLPLKYKNSPNLGHEFTRDFSNYILEEKNSKQIHDFWCFIQFTVDEEGKTENIHTYSNKKEIEQTIFEYLTDNNDFRPSTINNKTVKCDVYLNIFYMDSALYVPEYRYDNSLINVFDLK